jgi:hypothetical protein
MKKARKAVAVVLVSILVLNVPCYAEVHFDLVRTEVEIGRRFWDLEFEGISNQTDYVWPDSIPIPLVNEFPVPNIIIVGDAPNSPDNGYINYIDGEYYWTGRSGVKTASLNTGPHYIVPPGDVPLGTSIPDPLPVISEDWLPNLFPYNTAGVSTIHEQSVFNKKGNLMANPGRIGKWIFGWDEDNEKVKIFVDGIYGLETDIFFRMVGHDTLERSWDGVVYWEDDTTFYIKNYNLLLSTPKQPLYDALDALENAPKIMLNDTILAFANPPETEQDRLLVPMRFLFEQMGETVEWQGETQTAKVIGAQNVVSFSINDTTATVNGTPAEMDVPARLINDKTMVPLRFLSEELGYTVEWDAEHNIAKIITE